MIRRDRAGEGRGWECEWIEFVGAFKVGWLGRLSAF